jgi:hypothetical protein
LGVLLLVALALASQGCGGDDDASPPTTTRPPSSTTTTTSASPASTPASSDTAEVSSAYEAASRAFIDAAAIPDPNFPAIAATHTGPMLDQRRETLRALQLDHRVIRYPQPSEYRIDVEGVTIDGEVARLTVCVVDDGERVNVDTGEVIASGAGTVRWTAAMQLVEGSWRLAERREEARWDGVAGCAVQ